LDKTNQLIKLYFDEKIQIFKELEVNFISQLFNKLIDVYLKDGIVFTMGNGGGTSVANGFAVDLRTHPFTNEDKSITTDIRRIKVVDLCESASLITGVTNDIGGDFIFTEQLKNWLREKNENQKHLMIAFSGSGNSKNIINAIEFAKSVGVTTACISGRGGGLASKIVDIPITVPGHSKFPGQTGKNDNNFHIEEIQVSVGHMITGLLKEFVNKG
jgi:D-sedoheptulose 7-phosphate isomerase